MSDFGILASQFERFAQAECGASPLYRYLAMGIAQDSDLLAIADHGSGGPKPNLIFAAVHYLLLKGVEHPLAAHYPTVTARPLPPEGAIVPFRHFCLAHAEEIKALITTRRVQTNEVARSALLLPAFGFISRFLHDSPMALVEVGTSAGLLLFWDRYAYDYGQGNTVGNARSSILLRCELIGPVQPPIPASLPTILSRVGIDLTPIDLHDPDALLWLRALVWADQTERAERLTQAAELVARESPTLIRGDALALLPGALAATPPGAVACVFHSHVLNQFSRADRERLLQVLAAASRERDIWLLSLEGPNVMPMPGHTARAGTDPELWASLFSQGEITQQHLLARYEGHADWLRWL